MTWQRLPPIYREIAHEVCTQRELDVLAYHLAGHSDRAISQALNLSRRTVRDHLDNATRKIREHPDMPKEPAA